MDDVSRVTATNYVPTDCASLLCAVYMSDSSDTADILRARIKTMGVEEHFFEKEVGAPGARTPMLINSPLNPIRQAPAA
jgi:hypothetical protein